MFISETRSASGIRQAMSEPHGNTTQLQTLLDRAAAGDESAYGDLIAQAADRLLRLTGKMLRNYPHLKRWEQTDDVFQRAALRLHRSLGEVQPASPREFFGLATTQIRRTLIDLARHHFGPHGQAAHHHSDAGRAAGDGTAEPAGHGSAADGRPESLAEWAEFHATIDSLPDDEREAFSLVWYGGVTQRDAAQLLGVSERTVLRRLHQARTLLARHLGNPSTSDGESD